MKNLYLSLPIACLLLLSSSGCSKNEAPQALSSDQVPQAVENAFKDASPEAKTSADNVVQSLQNKDGVKAFFDLQSLGSRNDLTPEQREAVTRSTLSLNQQLRAEAAQGNQQAAEALQAYHAHK